MTPREISVQTSVALGHAMDGDMHAALTTVVDVMDDGPRSLFGCLVGLANIIHHAGGLPAPDPDEPFTLQSLNVRTGNPDIDDAPHQWRWAGRFLVSCFNGDLDMARIVVRIRKAQGIRYIIRAHGCAGDWRVATDLRDVPAKKAAS